MKGFVVTLQAPTIRAVLFGAPLLAGLLLHLVAALSFTSAPLSLSLWGITGLILCLALLGWQAGYSTNSGAAPSLVGFGATACIAVATLFVAKAQLSLLEARVVICAIPLMWSGICTFYFILGGAQRLSFEKILAAVAAGCIGVSVVAIIWYLGGSTLVVSRPAFDRLPYTFMIWEKVSWREHLFMLFDLRWSPYEKAICYHGHPPFFTIAHYLAVRFVRWYSGLPLDQGVRLSAFGYAILMSFALPLSTSYRLRFDRVRKWEFLAWLCAPMIVVLSIPDLWTGPLEMDADNCFPLVALGVYCSVCFVARAIETNERSAWIISSLFLAIVAVFVPIAAIMLAPAFIMMFVGSGRRGLLFNGIVVAVFSVASYLSILVLAKIGGFSIYGSGFLDRSGLITGGRGSLDSMWAALVTPATQAHLRPYSSIWFGVYSALIAVILNTFVTLRTTTSNLVFLLIAPVVLDLAIFSQSHSIHPYLYDIPVSVLGVLSLYWIASSEDDSGAAGATVLRPWVFLAFMCGAFGNFMSLRAFFLR